MQSPNIENAKVLDEYKILITFNNNEQKIFDLKPYLEYPVFKPLKEDEEFQRFQIIDGTIEWSCGADLSPDTFYIKSKPINSNKVI